MTLRNGTGPPALKTSSGMESDPGSFLLKFFGKSAKDLFYLYWRPTSNGLNVDGLELG